MYMPLHMKLSNKIYTTKKQKTPGFKVSFRQTLAQKRPKHLNTNYY